MVQITVPQLLVLLLAMFLAGGYGAMKLMVLGAKNNAHALGFLLQAVFRHDPRVLAEALDTLKADRWDHPIDLRGPGYDPGCTCPEAPNCGAADFHQDGCECVHCGK